MHFQTFSIVVGTRACNASCPFCISKQTGLFGTPPKVNWRNFGIACRLAQKAETTTVLLTGKGEPTLYPNNITETLKGLQEYDFPLIEMQTNGLRMAEDTEEMDAYLNHWYTLGLTTIALSVVHYDEAKNASVYTPDDKHYDLAQLIAKLHKIGFSVRLCVMMLKGYIDSVVKLDEMISFARQNKVEQLTFRNIMPSEVTDSPAVTEWTKTHALDETALAQIVNYPKYHGTLLQHLMHGMDVYDVNGQNVCMGNCLTRDTNGKDEFRQLIFFPEGSLYYDWQYKGARIL
jgi:molybdenum cofactor biosynthesis enzyme MoaA